MSSLTYETGSRTGFRLRVYTAAGRRSIWLGRIGEADANATRAHVEQLLESQTSDLPVPRQTQNWLDRASPDLRSKLAPIMGLFKTAGVAVDEFVDEKSRSVEQSSLLTIVNSLDAIIDAFGHSLVQSVDSEALRSIHDGLSICDSTKAKIAKHWKQFFEWCVTKRYIAENPAADFSTTVGVADKPFVEADLVHRVLAGCSDADLRAVVALSRWGGIRIPSELYPIVPSDIRRERIRINDAKRHSIREIPIFPELRRYLPLPFELHKSQLLELSPSGITSRFKRLLKMQSIPSWPSLWHSMRATRETELILRFGITTACLWIGNSPAVAAKHYAQVTPEDWQLATQQ